MVLIFFLHGVIVGSCYTSYMKRYLQFSIVVNTFRSPSCLKIWCFVQDIRYVHWVLVQLKLSIKERNTGLKRLRMCMCMLLGCQYQVATKECKSRGFKGVKEFRSVTRIFQSRGVTLCQTEGTRQIVMSISTLCFTRSDKKKAYEAPFPTIEFEYFNSVRKFCETGWFFTNSAKFCAGNRRAVGQ